MAADSPTADAPARADISSAEVEALLQKGPDGAAAAPGVPQPYDLVAQDRIVRGRMPTLDRLNERWVTEFQRKLGDLIHQPLEVTLQEVQLAPYGKWLASLPVPTSFNLYTIKPWPRNALVAVDGKLLFALVDRYYGGGGRAATKVARESLTPTEQRLNKVIVDLVTDHFRRALAPVAALEFQHAQSEVNASYLNMATPTETVVVTRVEVTLNSVGGSICLILPLSSFEPVRDKLAEGLKTVSPETRQRWRNGLRAQLENTSLDLTTVFLETDISMRELLQMKPGDILPIEMPKTAVLRSGSRPLLRGKFGRSRGYNAVSVLEAVKAAAHLPEETLR
ncbi:MAG TPA: FliM/FliN family flagellar motor switch protein [Gammaproteobacteria bacterium]|jgi:flagellar motor switch protein FliM|nr:FliM/FliN family flagellar motor switch protein [Gammaproteobacteria bacterium]